MLTDPGFIVWAGSGLIGVPFYVFVIITVIRTKTCSGSFFRLFIIGGVVNIVMEIDRSITFYIPEYTCKNNCFFSGLMNEHHWWIERPAFFVKHHGLLLQFLLATTVSCDRFIIICIQSRLGELWKSYHMVAVGICFVIPFMSVYPLFVGNCNVYFGYYNDTDNYNQKFNCDIDMQYNQYVIGTRLVTTILSAIFNFGVFLFFFLGKLKVSGVQRKTEMKLFIYSLTELVLQASATILSFYLDAWTYRDAKVYHAFSKTVNYLTDAATLLPPFVLLLTSKNVRQAVFSCARPKVTSVSVLSVK